MGTISVSELRKKPAKHWLKSASKDGLVVTSEGQPVAVLLPTDAASLGPTLSILRSVRALREEAALQSAAVATGADKTYPVRH